MNDIHLHKKLICVEMLFLIYINIKRKTNQACNPVNLMRGSLGEFLRRVEYVHV